MTFTQRVRSVQRKTDSLLCIGLDPDISKIPRALRTAPDPLTAFCRVIIEATSDLACAYKLNLAFFEAQGSAGWKALERVLTHVPDTVIRIGDAKRGDIGNSSAMYARGLFQGLGFDAVTVSPYMGSDSVLPFLTRSEKGAFVLTLTSNKGASDFQALRSNRRPLYDHVVRRARQWNKRRNCGLVVGATKPSELRAIRALAPGMPILIPGVGAQGGDLRSSVRNGCTMEGDLALINVGRAILYASGGAKFASAARSSAELMRNAMNDYRSVFHRTR